MDLEQNEQKVHSKKGSTNKFGEIEKKSKSRVDLEENEWCLVSTTTTVPILEKGLLA